MAFLFGGAGMFFLMVGMLHRHRYDETEDDGPRTSTSSIKHQSGPAPDFADDDERRYF
jgi:hypothetical protein